MQYNEQRTRMLLDAFRTTHSHPAPCATLETTPTLACFVIIGNHAKQDIENTEADSSLFEHKLPLACG